MQRVFFLFLALCLALSRAQDRRLESVYSLSFPHSPSHIWDISGSAVTTDSFIRLTPALQSRVGRLWNTRPSRMKEWEVEVKYRVSGGRLGADGWAFWYTSDRLAEGSVFGGSETWTGLAVFFDSFDNDWQRNNPAIMGLVRRPGDESSFEFGRDGGDEVTQCISHYRNPVDHSKVLIRYLNGRVSVLTDPKGEGSYQECISFEADLPSGYFFGFTARTGALVDNHDIQEIITYSYGTTSDYHEQPVQHQQAQHTPPEETPPLTQEQEQRQAESTEKLFKTRRRIMNKLDSITEEKQHDQQDEQAVTDVPPLLPEVLDGNPQDISSLFEEVSRKFRRIEEMVAQVVKLNQLLESRLSHEQHELNNQHRVFAESLKTMFESLATTQDVSGLATRASVDHIAGEVAHLRELVISMQRALSRNSDNTDDFDVLEDSLDENRRKLDNVIRSQSKITSQLMAEMQSVKEVNERNTSWGFWTYLFIFQIFFFLVFVGWKKMRDEQKSRIF